MYKSRLCRRAGQAQALRAEGHDDGPRQAQDTTLSEGTATALLERCGEDPFLLENEVDKLCALSGYQTVTTAMVAEMGTVSLEPTSSR